MDKEMKAKVDEFLKTNGTRELSLDEMNKISGGADAHGVTIGGQYFSEGEINDMFIGMTKAFGFDVAFAAFCDFTGFSVGENPLVGSYSDCEAMGVVLAQYWKVRGRLDDKGTSY